MDFRNVSEDAACKFIDSHGGTFEGTILGKDKTSGDQFVWVLVHGVGAVFQLHPSNLETHANGDIVFSVYDRMMPIKQVANQQPGDGTTPMFWYAQDPDQMLNKVKTWALLIP